MTEPAASPAAEKVPQSATPSDSPRGYADRVPDSRAFFPPKNFHTGPSNSLARAERREEGIYSHDPILDKDPDELWRFLLSNLEQPYLEVHLVATHTDTYWVDDVPINDTVTDFSIKIDVSNYVIPWSRIAAHPSYEHHDPSKPAPTLRETLEDYTRSDNKLKEFRVEKLVSWDYARVKKLLKQLVRSSGYKHTIEVNFPHQNYKVVAIASNRASRAVHSVCVQALCVVTCLWIVCWPAWYMARERVDRLVCEYHMAVSAEEFVSRNAASTQSTVITRARFFSS